MQPRDIVQIRRIDPLLCDVDLPLSASFFPAGFPLNVATNSRCVLEAAAESWGAFRREFDTPPMDFRILVEPGDRASSEPAFRKQRHLLSFVSDAHNFAHADSLTFFASFHLTEATVANAARLRWFYLEAMAYMLLTQRYVVSLHAACVAREQTGILICGKSGAGKSTLSFACARAGFTFLSDDCTWLLNDSAEPIAIGKPHLARFRNDASRHFPELDSHLAKLRPNGKVSIELPTSLFPSIRTASRCSIGALVFIDRTGEEPARIEPMPTAEAVEALLADLPSYGPEVNAMHEATIQRLTCLPAWRLRYRTLDEAIRLLTDLP
jgi:hypothetical protein